MSLLFKGVLWRNGPFLDLRIPHAKPSILTYLDARRAPQFPLRRAFAQASKPSSTRPLKPTTKASSKSVVRKPAAPKAQAPYLPPKTSFTNLLAARSSPTPLYQSPTTFTYPFACLFVGGGSIAYGVYNFYDSFLLPHPGLAPFIPWLMAFVCAFMLGVGAWCIRNGTKLVARVSAVPRPAANGGLRVRVEFRSLIGRQRVVERPVQDVKVGPGLTEARAEGLVGKGEGEMERYPATEEGRRAAQVAKRKAEREEYKDRLSNPFTHLAGSIGSVFRKLSRGIRRVVGREGFAELYVRRKDGGRWSTWRMDVSDGWIADGGVGLVRLLR